MTRKDYTLLGDALSYLPQCDQKVRFIELMCVVLKRDNPSFNERRFKSKCYQTLDANWVK